MRKSIFLTTFILASIISSGTIFAQKNRTRDAEYFPTHEFYVQYGTPTILELTSTLAPHTSKNTNEILPKNIIFSGVGAIGYNFSLSKRISIGMDAGISLASADIYSSVNDKETPQYSSHIVSYTGQLSMHWTYFEKGAIQVSSGVYAGVNYRDDTVKALTQRPQIEAPSIRPISFAYHLTALKVRYGDMIGGFAELGFGYRGLVNIGLSIKL